MGWSQNRHGVYGISSGGVDDAGVYGANNGAGPAIKAAGRLEVTGETIAEGDVKVSGAFKGNIGNGGAPFPRPAFESSWVQIFDTGDNTSSGATIGVGLYLPPEQYSRDNFVVDLQCKCTSQAEDDSYCNCPGYEGGGDTFKGIRYKILSNNDVAIVRGWDVPGSYSKARIRVWYYK